MCGYHEGLVSHKIKKDIERIRALKEVVHFQLDDTISVWCKGEWKGVGLVVIKDIPMEE